MQNEWTSMERPVRSYVLRQGRISPAQQRAYETLLPRYGLAYVPTPLDLAATFGRTGPKVLEIGSGMGETTVAMAGAEPDFDFIAAEVHTPGVGSLLKQIAERDLHNLRVIQHDAMDVVRDMIVPGALAGIRVFFPDPWPKKRHHKRRILQPDFVRSLAQRLAPGGVLHVATDWEDYATEVLATLTSEALLTNRAAGFAPRPASRPVTKFERRGLNLGHGVWDIVFERR